MPVKLHTLMQIIETIAPKRLAEEWDNVGLLVGSPSKEISRILITLDIDNNVLSEAIANSCDLIITHHPTIFKPLKAIREDLPTGNLVAKLIRHDIAVYAAHTNLDSVSGGVNDCLASLLGLTGVKPLSPAGEEHYHKLGESSCDILVVGNEGSKNGIGRIGKLPSKMTLSTLTEKVKQVLDIKKLRIVGGELTEVSKVAVVGGSGSSYISLAAFKGAQCLITGDIKYHDAIDALQQDLCLIDAGHFETERPVLAYLGTEIATALHATNKDVQIILSTSQDTPFIYK